MAVPSCPLPFGKMWRWIGLPSRAALFFFKGSASHPAAAGTTNSDLLDHFQGIGNAALQKAFQNGVDLLRISPVNIGDLPRVTTSSAAVVGVVR